MRKWALGLDFADTILSAAWTEQPWAPHDAVLSLSTPTGLLLGENGEVLTGTSSASIHSSSGDSYEPGPQRFLGESSTILVGEIRVSVNLVVEAIARSLIEDVMTRNDGSVPTELRLTCPDSWPERRREALHSIIGELGLDCPIRFVGRADAIAFSSFPSAELAVVFTVDRWTTEAALVHRNSEGEPNTIATGSWPSLPDQMSELASFALGRSATEGRIDAFGLIGDGTSATELRRRYLEQQLGCDIVELSVHSAAIGAAALTSPQEPNADRFDTRSVITSDEQVFDDDVQFTVYRPRAIRPGVWYPMLAFAHKSEVFVDEQLGPVDPLNEVARLAEEQLGENFERYVSTAGDSKSPLPSGTTIRFVPEAEGVEFNPPQCVFKWSEPVHEQQFRLRAEPVPDGTWKRGSMAVYCGIILIGEVSLAFRVSRDADERSGGHYQRGRAYRKIFASYSHLDVEVVERVEASADVFGDKYFRDVSHLRSGENWNPRLLELIRQADVFQLFWSSNSMESPFVQQEWTFALSLNRPAFVRPVYWENPLPEIRERNLPPEELRQLHFARLSPDANLPPATVDQEPHPRSVPSTVSPPTASSIPSEPPAPPPADLPNRAPVPMSCTQCGVDNPPGSRFCTNCGSTLSAVAPVQEQVQMATPGLAPNPPAQAFPASPPAQAFPASAPPYGFGGTVSAGGSGYRSGSSIDFRRLGIGDLVAIGGSILLFISLFLPWYSVPGFSATALGTGSDDGTVSGGWRLIILVLDVLILLYLSTRTVTPRGIRLPLPHWQLLTVALGLQFLLTLLAFLVKPSVAGTSFSSAYGAYLGLAASIIALSGGIVRRSEAEVVVPGIPRPGSGGQRVTCAQCGAAIDLGNPYCTTCGAPRP